MEKRRNNRREDDSRNGRDNNRRARNNDYENKGRRDERPGRGDRRNSRRDDDYDRDESRRRRAIRNENWFDIEPDQSNNFGSDYDRRDRRAPRNRDDRRDGRNTRGSREERDNRRPNRYGDSRRDNDRRNDRGEKKYREYRRNSSYNDYQYDFDDDSDDDFDFQPRNRRDRYNDRDNRPQRTSRHSDDNAPKATKNDGTTRLNKYIANAGICSRREADVLIESGAISVNGEVVTQLGFKVKPGDVVNYGGETLVSERKRYILLNKPKGFITTMDDPQERKTVMNLVADACTERIYPVGRLDRNTTGLLLFTNDGELAKKLTHPSTGARKVYHVELDKPLTATDRRRMLEGITLEDGDIAVDAVEFSDEDRNVVGVELHSGRNRIVRRIFESLGYEVYKLDRVIFAELTKKNLPRGRWRELTAKEVGFLKML